MTDPTPARNLGSCHFIPLINWNNDPLCFRFVMVAILVIDLPFLTMLSYEMSNGSHHEAIHLRIIITA